MHSTVSTTRQDSQDSPKNVATSGQAAQRVLVPPVDVFEDEKGITVLADLPGVSRDRLGIRVDGDSLIIEATASTPAPDAMQLSYREVESASYRRAFTLSRELDVSRIDAKLKDGVLTLAIPKAEGARPRKIEVKLA